MEEHPHVHGVACLEQGCDQLVDPLTSSPDARRAGRRWVLMGFGAAAVVLAAGVAVASSGGDGAKSAEPPAARDVQEPVLPPSEPEPEPAERPDTAAETGFDAAIDALTAPRAVPPVIGGTLLKAQKTLLAEQFLPQAVDGSGEGRVPVAGSNWTVVAQEPAAGTLLPFGRG